MKEFYQADELCSEQKVTSWPRWQTPLKLTFQWCYDCIVNDIYNTIDVNKPQVQKGYFRRCLVTILIKAITTLPPTHKF